MIVINIAFSKEGNTNMFLRGVYGPYAWLALITYNRVPKCDVTKMLFSEYFNFGSGS